MEHDNSWRRAFRDSLPVMAGYIVLGMGFGVLMHAQGFAPGWSIAMSLFIYAGSLQFVGVGLLSGGAGILTTALTTLLVNARHLFYGISMLEPYRQAGRYKPYLIFALTDETYSILCEAPDREPAYCFRLSLLNHCYWVTGTVLGAAAGPLIPFDTAGIDFSLTALFVTVFLEQWLTRSDHRPALIGLGASAACLLLFGPERFLLPSMAAILALLLVLGGKEAAADE